MANTLLNRLSRTPRDWARYIFADKAERDWTSRWLTGIDDAREEGITIGEARGEERGSRAKTLEAARNLLAMHVLTNEQIAQATGLSAEEIAQL